MAGLVRGLGTLVVAISVLMAGRDACAQGPSDRHRLPHTSALPNDPIDSPGWTTFTPSPDTRIVYVSTTDGDDAFDGLSINQPKKSPAAGYDLMRDGFPDWMLLKRGDSWNTAFPLWSKGGRSASEPMLIGSYGQGPRPVMNSGSGQGFNALAYPKPLAHLALTDIFFNADRAEGTSVDTGVTILNAWSDVLIENCMVQGFRNNIVIEPLDTRPSNMRIRRCIVVDCFCTINLFSEGIYAGGVDGLLVEECIFDHNGWKRGVPGAQATIFNHNMYLHGSCTGVVTRGNISSRASATGISQRCAGLSEDNLLLQNPVGLYFGVEDNWPTVRSAVRNNVALDARDIDSINGRGFAYWISSLRSAEIYGNVAAAQRTGSDNVIAFRFTADLRSFAFTRNTVYDWTMGSSGVALSLDLPFARGVIASDNVFVQPAGGFLVEYVAPVGGDYGRVLGRNRYYTSNTEPHQFYYGTSYTEWANSGNEIFSQFGAPAMPDPQRDISTYMTTLGLTPSLEAFLSLARQQERTTWDDRFTAAAVNAYIRQGLGVGRRGCRADFNDDGQVNVLDIVEFQTAWSSGDPRGDFDLDGAWTSDDLIQFQGVFAAGCL